MISSPKKLFDCTSAQMKANITWVLSFPFFFCFFFGKDINMHITVLDEKYNHKRLFHHLCPGVHRMHKTLAERLCMCLDSRRTVSTAPEETFHVCERMAATDVLPGFNPGSNFNPARENQILQQTTGDERFLFTRSAASR